jgi:hypothetical protein
MGWSPEHRWRSNKIQKKPRPVDYSYCGFHTRKCDRQYFLLSIATILNFTLAIFDCFVWALWKASGSPPIQGHVYLRSESGT